jgi:hypothetical protein
MGGTPPVPNLPPGLNKAILDGLESLFGTLSSIYTKTLEMETRMHVPPPFNYAVAGISAAVGIVLYVIIALLIAILVPVAVPLITLFMEQLLEIRKDTPQAQLELSAASLSEFLGVEIDAGMLSTGKGVQNSLQVARLIGDALYNRLYTEFGIHMPSGPGPGEKAARTFSGFAVNFGTQNAMISTLADAISFHELEQFRELGVETARNLGMGRLQRMALGTLMQNVIQKPYNRELQAKLTPYRMDAGTVVHSWNAGYITTDVMQSRLQDMGYPPEDIAGIVRFNSGKNSISTVATLLRYGEITQDKAMQLLMDTGIDQAHAKYELDAVFDARADNEIDLYITALADMLTKGIISETDWDAYVKGLPRTDAELGWKKATALLKVKYKTKSKLLTWAQVTTAFENGIVDVDYVVSWLDTNGYSDDDQTNMLLLLAVATSKFADKAAAAAAKATKAPTPPPKTGP